MPTFAILIMPSANRVYSGVAADLTMAELEVVSERTLGGRARTPAVSTIAGVAYVTFEADELDERDVARLSNLSALYALFEVQGEVLRPIELHRRDRFDDDLLTIQRYTGKTNEQFTKLLLNVTLLWSAGAGDGPVRVLDPLCGRGTTLNQALMYGFDAAGVERDGRAVDAYETFIKTWLQDKRLKHHTEQSRIRRNGKMVGRRVDLTVAATKDDQRAGSTISLTAINDDTSHVADHFKKRSFDVIVADLPYGVQHGSRTAEALERSPLDLVEGALPGWLTVLKRGGAVGLAWNTRVLPRAELAAALTGAGLDVADSPAMRSFAHRVDQSIQRDLIVGVLPR